jgi:hypothetical protein
MVEGMTEWCQDWDEEAAKALLAVHRLRQKGLEVKLDKGFEPGVYGVTVEYGESAQRIGFTPARRQARDYATRLHGQLSQMAGNTVDKLDDGSLNAGQGQKRDLEGTFLTFAVTTDDGSWHDAAMKENFRTALVRTEREPIRAGRQHLDSAPLHPQGIGVSSSVEITVGESAGKRYQLLPSALRILRISDLRKLHRLLQTRNRLSGRQGVRIVARQPQREYRRVIPGVRLLRQGDVQAGALPVSLAPATDGRLSIAAHLVALAKLA